MVLSCISLTSTDVEHLFRELLAIVMPFTTIWMDLEHIMLSEIVRKRQVLNDIYYMWNLKKSNL